MMTQEFSQWLQEIRALQRQVTDLRRERDEAYTSASNWRSLYDTEAKQRREEAIAARQTIEALQAEIGALRQQQMRSNEPNRAQEVTLSPQLSELSRDELQRVLAETLVQCDCLRRDLKAERHEHLQTRQSLMSALGDTVDRLTKERLARSDERQAGAENVQT